MSDGEDRTLFCGNLAPEVTEALLYELFLQAGPLSSVRIPRGKAFAFVEYKHESAVDYAVELFAGTRLHNRELTIRNSSRFHNNNANKRPHSNDRGYDSAGRSSRSHDHAPLMQMPQPSRNFIPPYMMPAMALLPQLQFQLQQQLLQQHNSPYQQQHNQYQQHGNSYQQNSSNHRHHGSSNHNDGFHGKPYQRSGDRHNDHRSDRRHSGGRHSDGHHSDHRRSRH